MSFTIVSYKWTTTPPMKMHTNKSCTPAAIPKSKRCRNGSQRRVATRNVSEMRSAARRRVNLKSECISKSQP
eukprot:6227375-Prymnesium_polylepis.1